MINMSGIEKRVGTLEADTRAIWGNVSSLLTDVAVIKCLGACHDLKIF